MNDKEKKMLTKEGWEVTEVFYFDLKDKKVDDLERFIVHLEHEGEQYRVLSWVSPDGGIEVPDLTPDPHMEPIEGHIRGLSIKATVIACCKLDIYTDPIQIAAHMAERDKHVHEGK